MEATSTILPKCSVVPFIDSLGFIRNAPLFIEDNFERYGDFLKLTIPTQRVYATANPVVLKHVLVRNEENYHKSKIYWGQLRKIVGTAMATLEGDEWVWQKKLQMTVFTPDMVKSHLQNVIYDTYERFQEWDKAPSPFDVIHAFSAINVAVILKTLFGYNNKAAFNEAAYFIEDGQAIINYRSKYPWRLFTAGLTGKNNRTKKYLKFFDNLAVDIVGHRKSKGDSRQLIDLLIAESSLMKSNSSIDQTQIRNEIIIHLGAGTETAAVGLGWTLYLLWKYPAQLAKLQEEIRRVAGRNNLTLEHYRDLRFTDLVVKESLRLFPPSHAIVRDAVADDSFNGIAIKKGDTFFISAYGLHRNPGLWDQPCDFIPERFQIEPPKYSYIPYGAGRHTCIGRHMAQPMLVLMLAAFIQQFDFKFCVKGDVKPVSLSTLKPNQPLMIHVTRKTS